MPRRLQNSRKPFGVRFHALAADFSFARTETTSRNSPVSQSRTRYAARRIGASHFTIAHHMNGLYLVIVQRAVAEGVFVVAKADKKVGDNNEYSWLATIRDQFADGGREPGLAARIGRP